MIKTVFIIEDEKPNADRLKRLLKRIRPEINVLNVEETVVGAVAWLSSNPQPDLILMDIRLADGLSFEIFNQVAIKSQVIFTTAYDEYAVRAFKYNSIDYLLKPVEEEELETSLTRCETIITGTTVSADSIEGLLNFLQPKDFRSRFLLPYRDGYKTILVKEIAYFNSESGINKAIFYNGSNEVIPQTLEELEKQLDPKHFFRVNRQFIIHIDAIVQVHNYFNGKLKLELKKQPDLEIIVSREKASVLKSWLDY